jgi:hemoglobin-like flavoprotein
MSARISVSEVTPKEVFFHSVKRCTASPDFIPAFYQRFLSSSDEVKRKFRFTDFEKQHKMLQRSLELCVGATAGEPEALAEMRYRATSHDREHLNIEPRFYESWLETIIATAKDFDEQWNDEVEAAWRTILGHVIGYMSRKY